MGGFCKFGSFQPYLTQGQLDWSTMMFIESPFSWIPHLPNFRSGGLMVDGTVNCKDNKEEKTREVAGIRMHHIS